MAASWRGIYHFPYLFQLVFVFALMRVLSIGVALDRRLLDLHRLAYDPQYFTPPIKHILFPELLGTNGAIIMAVQYIGMFLLVDVSWMFGRQAHWKNNVYGYAWRCAVPAVLMSVVERAVVAVDGFHAQDIVSLCVGTCALSFVVWPIQKVIMTNRDYRILAAQRLRAILRAVRIVDSLPVVSRRDVSPNSVCPTCSARFSDTIAGTPVRIPHCGHIFCKRCVFGSIVQRDAYCPTCRFDFYRGYAAPTDRFRSLWSSLRSIRRALVDTAAVIVTGILNFLSFVIIRCPRAIFHAFRSAFGCICWLLSYLDELHNGPLAPDPVNPDNGRTYNNKNADLDLFIIKEQLKTLTMMMRTESAENARVAIEIKRIAAALERLIRTHDGHTTAQTTGSTADATRPCRRCSSA
ncbi:hypothetical protein FOMPIDRAFT_1050078 [Fomitopsis schrenkii]|uniref:RING-type domain-containing protein n=1 Tax=Fomitopsis schrenkii TaxID=2126942 RepID=S8E9K3_FOMSC|nr:hypothetical protein FOMPIDRAFT_1050078 [Fomitopsis schrenkii]